MNRQKTGRRNAAVWRMAAVIFALLLLFFIWVGVGKKSVMPGVFLMEPFEGGTEVLLLAARDDVAWMVCSGRDSALLMKLNAHTGRELLRREVEAPLAGAAFQGGRVLAWGDGQGETELYAFDADSLEQVSGESASWDPAELLWLDWDGAGHALAVTGEAPAFLHVRLAEGREETVGFPERITFLQADQLGNVYLCAGERLYLGEILSEGDGPVFRKLPGEREPVLLAGPGVWMERDGAVCRLKDGGAEQIFRLEGLEVPPLFCCLDGKNCLVLSNGGSTLEWYDERGRRMGSRTTENEVAALCASGAVTQGKTGIFYVPLPEYGNAEQDPLPTPAPIDETGWVEGEYLVVPVGTTAAELRRLMEPETADIRDSSGAPVMFGGLATGMRVNNWTVVVPGDCNGTGTITGSDVRKAMELSLSGDGEVEGPYGRAADLDEDGRITGTDLVNLSALAAE